MLRWSALFATWHFLLLSRQTVLADLMNALEGDDECSVDGCSTDLLQVNRSSGRKNNTSPSAQSTAEQSEQSVDEASKANPLNTNMNINNASHLVNKSFNASLKSSSGWVGCWYYGCRSSYHAEFYCQCNSGCRRFGNCCGDFGTRCWYLNKPTDDRRRRRRRAPKPEWRPNPSPPQWRPNPSPPQNGGILTVYHQTSPQACKAILASSFRPGSDGHCGGAIYFAMSPEATKTKAIGTQSQGGCVIQAKVDVGRVKKEGPRCGHKWKQGELRSQGFDSIEFDPGDGQEVVIFNSNRVKSMKIIPYNNAWRPTYNVR